MFYHCFTSFQKSQNYYIVMHLFFFKSKATIILCLKAKIVIFINYIKKYVAILYKVYFSACFPSERHLLQMSVYFPLSAFQSSSPEALVYSPYMWERWPLSQPANFPISHFYYGKVISIVKSSKHYTFHGMTKHTHSMTELEERRTKTLGISSQITLV